MSHGSCPLQGSHSADPLCEHIQSPVGSQCGAHNRPDSAAPSLPPPCVAGGLCLSIAACRVLWDAQGTVGWQGSRTGLRGHWLPPCTLPLEPPEHLLLRMEVRLPQPRLSHRRAQASPSPTLRGRSLNVPDHGHLGTWGCRVDKWLRPGASMHCFRGRVAQREQAQAPHPPAPSPPCTTCQNQNMWPARAS